MSRGSPTSRRCWSSRRSAQPCCAASTMRSRYELLAFGSASVRGPLVMQREHGGAGAPGTQSSMQHGAGNPRGHQGGTGGQGLGAGSSCLLTCMRGCPAWAQAMRRAAKLQQALPTIPINSAFCLCILPAQCLHLRIHARLVWPPKDKFCMQAAHKPFPASHHRTANPSSRPVQEELPLLAAPAAPRARGKWKLGVATKLQDALHGSCSTPSSPLGVGRSPAAHRPRPQSAAAAGVAADDGAVEARRGLAVPREQRPCSYGGAADEVAMAEAGRPSRAVFDVSVDASAAAQASTPHPLLGPALRFK